MELLTNQGLLDKASAQVPEIMRQQPVPHTQPNNRRRAGRGPACRDPPRASSASAAPAPASRRPAAIYTPTAAGATTVEAQRAAPQPAMEASSHPPVAPRGPSRRPDLPVGARLLEFSWEHLQLTNWHRRVLTVGLRWHWTSMSPLADRPHFISLPTAPAKQDTLLTEIKALVTKRALVPADLNSPGFYSHLFVVPKKSGGF